MAEKSEHQDQNLQIVHPFERTPENVAYEEHEVCDAAGQLVCTLRVGYDSTLNPGNGALYQRRALCALAVRMPSGRTIDVIEKIARKHLSIMPLVEVNGRRCGHNAFDKNYGTEAGYFRMDPIENLHDLHTFLHELTHCAQHLEQWFEGELQQCVTYQSGLSLHQIEEIFTLFPHLRTQYEGVDVFREYRDLLMRRDASSKQEAAFHRERKSAEEACRSGPSIRQQIGSLFCHGMRGYSLISRQRAKLRRALQKRDDAATGADEEMKEICHRIRELESIEKPQELIDLFKLVSNLKEWDAMRRSERWMEDLGRHVGQNLLDVHERRDYVTEHQISTPREKGKRVLDRYGADEAYWQRMAIDPEKFAAARRAD
jgi:hypothetical protein